MGSRGIPVGGSAVYSAAEKVRVKATRIAAHMLEADESDLELADGRFRVRGAPDQGVTMGEVAMRSFKPHRLPPGVELGLDETAHYEPSNLSYPSGAHCCVVEIDRDTGRVTIARYVAVDDCGTVINPLMARGQIHGGVAQGIAQALLEEVSYGADGQPASGTLVDYTVPAAPDLPAYETEHQVTRTSFNPLGAKGLGESGATGAPQAVVNAVVDALSHLGVPRRRDALHTAEGVADPARRDPRTGGDRVVPPRGPDHGQRRVHDRRGRVPAAAGGLPARGSGA